MAEGTMKQKDKTGRLLQPLRRRDLLAMLGGTVAWPLVARGQPTAIRSIGYFLSGPEKPNAQRTAAFRQGLNDANYTEGRNVAIEYRYAEGRYDALPGLATDLVRLGVALIFTGGGAPSARAAIAATSTIPIVFAVGSDPVVDGLVTSLNRPAANVTGVAMMLSTINVKPFEILCELVPGAVNIGVLVNPTFSETGLILKQLEAAASILKRQLMASHATNADEIDAAFETYDQRKVAALYVPSEPFLNGRIPQIVTLASRHGIPAMYEGREFVAAGGLISYGPSFDDAYRQAGRYAGKILDGTRPLDLPVIQSSKFDLVINIETAKSLGITVPTSILVRADEVIE
jgi:putative tryptophan/tyrosine transport system substrate-binding protein